MVDLTLCNGKITVGTVNKDCPERNECYRFTAHARLPWQSYIGYIMTKGRPCYMFIDSATYCKQNREISRIKKTRGKSTNKGHIGSKKTRRVK